MTEGDLTVDSNGVAVKVVSVGVWFIVCKYLDSERGVAIPTEKNKNP